MKFQTRKEWNDEAHRLLAACVDIDWRKLKMIDVWNVKCVTGYYRDLRNGKNFTIRKDDRDYKVGDWICFHEITPASVETYTGSVTFGRIGYILRNVPDFGLQHGYAILGLDRVSWDDK